MSGPWPALSAITSNSACMEETSGSSLSSTTCSKHNKVKKDSVYLLTDMALQG